MNKSIKIIKDNIEVCSVYADFNDLKLKRQHTLRNLLKTKGDFYYEQKSEPEQPEQSESEP